MEEGLMEDVRFMAAMLCSLAAEYAAMVWLQKYTILPEWQMGAAGFAIAGIVLLRVKLWLDRRAEARRVERRRKRRKEQRRKRRNEKI